ncbi:MAG: hypothetical protein L0229_12230 [Blastocatellia bacterium]|nr:hypothetical protein [Blastocatellia bacterium]
MLRKPFVVALMAMFAILAINCSKKNLEAPPDAQPAQSSQAEQENAALDLPAPLLERLPGWLGFATVSESDWQDGKTRFNWSPSHPDGQVIIFEEDEPSENDWAKVPPETRLTALSTAGRVEVTFLRSSSERYGCEEGKTTMISFRAAQPLPEGPVWLLPRRAGESAAAFPIQENPVANKDQRVWSAAGASIILEKTGRYTAELRLALEGQPPRVAKKIEKDVEREREMLDEDEEVPPIALKNEDGFSIGIPEPVGAFKLSEDGPLVIVLATYSFEGIHFEPLLVGRDEIIEGPDIYVYICAY